MASEVMLKWVGRSMRWAIYILLAAALYAFGSAVFTYIQVRTGWWLSAEEARDVPPALGDTAGLFMAASFLIAMFAVLAIRVVRRLEQRADEI
jgi:ABC-type Fe3+ transport system permease subunit